ncbi:hypothetical protein D3C71_1742650 [compost metagenome]
MTCVGCARASGGCRAAHRKAGGAGTRSGGFTQRVTELEITGHITGGVGVGDVAGDGALTFRTQQERVAVKIQLVRHLVKHVCLTPWVAKAPALQAFWRGSIMETAPFF